MDPLVVVGSAIVGVLGFIGSLAALKGQWDLRAMTNQHERDLARLRSDLGIAEARVQHALSLGGEVHLRLFERAAEATAAALRSMSDWEDAIHQMRVVPPVPVADKLNELVVGGLFLPPELDEPFATAQRRIAEIVFSLSEKRESGAPNLDALTDAALGVAKAARQEFEREAIKWKRQHWNRYLAMEEKSDGK